MGIDERIKIILPIIILILTGSSLFSHTPTAEAVLDSTIYMTLFPTESMDLVGESAGPGIIYLKNHSGYDWAVFDIDDIVGRPAGNDHASISLSAFNHGSAKATLEIYISFFMDPNEASDSQAWFEPIDILPDGSEDINIDSDVIQGDLPVMSPGKVRLYMRQVETTYADIRITLDEYCFITIPYLPDQPVADAGEDRTEYRNQVVTFDGSGSYQMLGEEMEYSWDFNAANGIINEASGITVAHLFEIPGTYTVTLSVFLGALFDTDTLTVIVEEDTPPVLSIGGDVESFKNALISLSVVECYDPEGEDVNITWNMGDGTLLYGRTIEHAYSNEGIYQVNVSATDSRNYNNKSLTITIQNRAPTGEIVVEGDIVTGFPIGLRAVNVVDPDGDNITMYKWYFGDGDVGYGENVSHTYTSSGYIKVTLVLSDGFILAEAYTFIDIPENANPDAVITGPVVAMLGEVLTFTGTGSADYEGQQLFFNWTYGDELESASEDISITVAYDTTGTKRITLTVTDAAGGWDDLVHYVEIYETDLFYPSEVNADTGVLFMDFDCIEGPREKNDLVDYVDDEGMKRSASYLGYRSYKLLVPEGKDCFVEVEVLEGGPVDLLLLETGEYSRFKNGESQLLLKDYGTDIEAYYISFKVQQKGTLYFVVNNDGRFVDGHEPVGGARYKITIRYPDEEDPLSEYVDEPEDEGDMSFLISCCSVLAVVGLIIIAVYVASKKAEAARAGQKPKPSLKSENVADRGPKPREVRIDPHKKVYGGKVARDAPSREPNWKKLDDKFSLTRMEREIGKKDVDKPQFLKTEQPHWEGPRELDEAEVDPMMKMGEEEVIPIEKRGEPEERASPSGEEEELLDIETIRRKLEERRRGASGGNRMVLPPPPHGEK